MRKGSRAALSLAGEHAAASNELGKISPWPRRAFCIQDERAVCLCLRHAAVSKLYYRACLVFTANPAQSLTV